MKQNVKNILLVINTILLVICLVQIANLRAELQNLSSNTGNQISNILTNLNNSYSYIEEIEEKLEENASIISKSEFEFGEIDIKAGTVEVHAYVIPKEYQPDVTQAFFLCGDEEVPAEYVGGKYMVTLKVPLYEDVSISSVIFKESGTIRTESLDWFFNPRNKLLPFVYAQMYGTTSYGKANGMGTWTFSGDVEVDVKAKYVEEFEVEIAEIVRFMDGKEVERFDITLEAMTAHNTFSYNWNPTYEIPYGSTQELFVDITMKGGMVYRSQISYCRMDEQGNPIEDEGYWENPEGDIYDTEGNLLYSLDEELL